MLATKAGISRRRGERETYASRGRLLADLDASLRRLGVDHVDLWQVHTWVDGVPLEETLTALDLAVASGRASYVGISNYTGWQTAQAATWQRAVPGPGGPRLHAGGVLPAQPRRSSTRCCRPPRRSGLGILPWSPLGRGVLTGKYRTRHPVGLPRPPRRTSPSFVERLPRRARQPGRRGGRAGPPTGSAGRRSRWPWPGCATARASPRPIVGARTATQLPGALGVEELTLPPEIVDALDDVSED